MPVKIIPAPVKKGKQLSFPPLTKNWTCKGEGNWPGAEYTRRTRLKTTCDPTFPFGQDFIEELKATLGENYDQYEAAMQPAINRKQTRGNPPAESGHRPVKPAYVLPRADGGRERALDEPDPLAGTTMSLGGTLSRTRQSENMYTKFGPAPEYMFEDREKMQSMSEWFEKYGRPKEGSLNLGPRQLFTHFTKSSKRCCGEPSGVDKMVKGFVTA
jgi:hypothetical protein